MGPMILLHDYFDALLDLVQDGMEIAREFGLVRIPTMKMRRVFALFPNSMEQKWSRKTAYTDSIVSPSISSKRRRLFVKIVRL